MRPFLHAHLVNGRTGDPAVYVETLYEKQTILFDLGDISNLPSRKILRLEHVFVSHTHIDHFIGFDRLLRLLAGREQKLHLYGPPDFIAQVQHKLQAYRWDLVDRYVNDLALSVTEVLPSLDTRKALFRLKNAFALEPQPASPAAGGTICAEPRFRVSTAVLESPRNAMPLLRGRGIRPCQRLEKPASGTGAERWPLAAGSQTGNRREAAR